MDTPIYQKSSPMDKENCLKIKYRNSFIYRDKESFFLVYLFCFGLLFVEYVLFSALVPFLVSSVP